MKIQSISTISLLEFNRSQPRKRASRKISSLMSVHLSCTLWEFVIALKNDSDWLLGRSAATQITK